MCEIPIIPFLFSFFSFSFLSLFPFSLHLISSPHRVLIFSLSCSRSSVCSASSSSSSSRPRMLTHGVEVRRLDHRPLPHLCAALAVAAPLCRPCRPSRLLQPPPPRLALQRACPATCASPALWLGLSAASTSPRLRHVCSVCLCLAHARRNGNLGRAHMPGRRSRRKPIFSAPALSHASSQRVFRGFFEGAER